MTSITAPVNGTHHEPKLSPDELLAKLRDLEPPATAVPAVKKRGKSVVVKVSPAATGNLAVDRGTTPTAPSWMDEPCPGWCDVEHREGDFPDDRRHWRHHAEIPMSLRNPVKVLGGEVKSAWLVVGIEQHVNARRATVWINDQIGCEVSAPDIELTPAETRLLGVALAECAELADDGDAR